MKVKTQRVYDLKSKPDKSAVLADRLWPRGIPKTKLSNVPWLKELTPSNELRKWFHEDKSGHWKEFNKEYASELRGNKKVIKESLSKHGSKITLLTGVKEIERSHIPTLTKYLEKFK